ncbi:PAS domain S-box protein [Methanobacterium alkalithermotolerans]|uniref:PAS domain S-box protein n=1 Tax=Methanobacterium alkalithermotolerans TaxID=2731220 RepID=A0A8T8K3M7_9EURY|nr:PAS domain S-box protein [Methanobacterium alkalithermotolerans]QUH22587.1 PAS domain S-box protein [Methanobacterium alkalithermotolerans]
MKRILIVEDEAISALDLKRKMEVWGFEVVGMVSYGEDAIEKALESKVDLILMDIMLKGEIDGITAHKEISKHQDIPVIYLTAYGDMETTRRAQETVPENYLLKPVDDRELKFAVEMALYKNELKLKINESNQRYQELLDKMKRAVIKVQVKNQGEIFIIKDINPAGEKMVKLKREDILDRDISSFFRGIDGDKLLQLFKKAYFTGDFLQSPVMRYSDENLDLWVEAFIYLLPSGEIMAIFEDRTQELKTKKELEKIQSNLSTLMENTKDCIWSTDLDSKVLYLNKAFKEYFHRVYNYQLQEGDNITESVPSSVKDNWKLLLERVKKGEQFSITHQHQEGQKPNYYSIFINPIFQDDQITGASFVARNITSWKEKEYKIRNQANLLHNIHEGIIVLDRGLQIKSWNQAAQKIYGWTQSEVKGRSEKDVLNTRFQDDTWEKVKEILKDKGIYEGEALQKDYHNQLLTVHLHINTYQDENNQPGYIMLIRDISRQKKAEKKTKEQKVFYEQILNSINDGIIVTDSEDRIQFINQGMYHLADSKGADYSLVHILEDFKKETIQEFAPYYLKARETLQNVEYDAIKVVTPGGRKSYQSGWMIPRLIDGEYQGMICTIDDVTRQRKAEMELQISKKYYESLFENNSSPTLIFDNNGLIIKMNKEAETITGYNRKEMVDKVFWMELVSEKDLPRMREYNKKRQKGDPTVPSKYRFRFYNKKKEIVVALANVVVLPGNKETMVSIIDITDYQN